ncbi:hypothetical protein ACW9YQ_24605 (plasmid) [Paraburkholderia strydomiana]
MSPDLNEHIELREQVASLTTAFLPFEHWVADVNKCAIALSSLGKSTGFWRRRGLYNELLLEGAVWHVSRPPQPARIESRLPVHILTWKLKLAAFPPMYSRRAVHGSVDFLSVAAKTYRTTLRQILRWLYVRHERLQLNTNLRANLTLVGKTLMYATTTRIDTRGWDICELAYLILRFWVEDWIQPRMSLLSEIRDARPRCIPQFARAGSRALRCACRAAFLAAYGTVVAHIRSSSVNGFLPVECLRCGFDAAIMSAYKTDYLRHIGLVVMPAVEDLIPSLKAVPHGLKQSWSETWVFVSEISRDQG